MKDDKSYALEIATKSLEEHILKLKQEIEKLELTTQFPLALKLASIEGVLSFMQKEVKK